MIYSRSKRVQIIGSIAILLAITLVPLVGMSDSPVQADEALRIAPINPAFLEFGENPPEHSYGYIPPPMDLSHLNEISVHGSRMAATLPSRFDWRDQDKVTSIKNQKPCGTCWVHGTLAAVESKVLIEESVTYDFSEQNLDCCTDPAWVYLIGNRCRGGGWSWLAADTLIKKGTRLEICQPYNTCTINSEACYDSCQSIKMVTDYRVIADQATSPVVIGTIKNALYNHGPLTMSYAADDGSHMYNGSVYYWPSCPPWEVNHLVCIVGWDDSISHPAGGGSGAWIVKNSWGTDWGTDGFFYLCYGSAGMCEVTSLDYKDYDTNEQLYYWDEAGQIGGLGNWEDCSGWMASIFASNQDGNLTHVDFWTTSNNVQYEIYVYLDGNISDGLQNLASSQAGTCQEFGYYSIPLILPVSLVSGQSFTIAVKMTTPGYKYPVSVENKVVQGGSTRVAPPIQRGKSFLRHGDGEPWIDAATQGCNACLRGRVTSVGTEGQADITVSTISFDKAMLTNTIQDYTLVIGNEGNANLAYDISDRETMVGGSQTEYNGRFPQTSPVKKHFIQLNNLEPISFPTSLTASIEIAYDDGAGGTSVPAAVTATVPHNCSWLDESPKSGLVAPGNSCSVTITIDTTGLPPDDYSAEIVIASNDPDENPTIVQMTLHVVSPINNQPNVPSSPSPVNHAMAVDIDADLSWTGRDPDVGDTVVYDVYFGSSATPPLVSNDQPGTIYDPGVLSYNTQYYWKIMATDNHGASTMGPLWDFTTGAEPVPGITWIFPYGVEAFLCPMPANGRPYLDAAVALPTGTEPAELLGVYWLDEMTWEWRYFNPKFTVNTLNSLEPDQAYLVAVSGACVWQVS